MKAKQTIEKAAKKAKMATDEAERRASQKWQMKRRKLKQKDRVRTAANKQAKSDQRQTAFHTWNRCRRRRPQSIASYDAHELLMFVRDQIDKSNTTINRARPSVLESG